MSSVLRKTKLLIVDASPSLAEALKTFAKKKGYAADVFSEPALASQALEKKLSVGQSYDCIVLGWPRGSISLIADLLGKIGKSDYSDLPVIILSDEQNNDVETLCGRRANTHSLLWRNYKQIDGIVKTIPGVDESNARGSQKILLVDDTPSVCLALKDRLEANGYHVALASTAEQARKVLAEDHYGLLVTELFLDGESGEDLCLHIQGLQPENRPVYAMMTSKNLDTLVQRSVALGAIACLDKTESTEVIFARLVAIIKALPKQFVESQADSKSSQQSVLSLASMMELSVTPSLLIDSEKTIIAANNQACDLLGADKDLLNTNFADVVHFAPIKISDEPVKALFCSTTGEGLSVIYRSRMVSGADFGRAGNFCMLSFEVLGKSPAIPDMIGLSGHAMQGHALQSKSVSGNARSGNSDRSNASSDESDLSVAKAVKSEPVRVEKPKAETKSSDQADLVDVSALQRAISKAVSTTGVGGCSCLLALDVKVAATVTGDRLSLGRSEPMLSMVEERLAVSAGRGNSLAYAGDGRFVLLITANNERQARAQAEHLVAAMPSMINYLSDVKLISHSSFVNLAGLSTIPARQLLKHSFAACLKTELDGNDNAIYVIDAQQMLQPRRVPGKPKVVRQPDMAKMNNTMGVPELAGTAEPVADKQPVRRGASVR